MQSFQGDPIADPNRRNASHAARVEMERRKVAAEKLPSLYSPSHASQQQDDRSQTIQSPSHWHARQEAAVDGGDSVVEILARQVKKLATEVQHLQTSTREREEDLQYHSRQSYEKLSRMHQLITNKERQLMDKIALIQGNLEQMDHSSKESRERRIRLAEQKTDMVKQAIEKRASLAETNVARERQERLESEAKLREDVRHRIEQALGALKANEEAIKSSNERTRKELHTTSQQQQENLNTMKAHLQESLVSLANRIQSTQASISGVEEKVGSRMKEIATKLQDLLKAEIKVRTSMVAKVTESQEKYEAIMNEELSKCLATMQAKTDLFQAKIEEIESSTRENQERLRESMTENFKQVHTNRASDQQAISNQFQEHQEKSQALHAEFTEFTKKTKFEIGSLEDRLFAAIRESCQESQDQIKAVEEQFSKSMEEKFAKLERLLSNEQLDRHQHCQNIKNDIDEKFSQLHSLGKQQEGALHDEIGSVRRVLECDIQDRHKQLQDLVKVHKNQISSEMEKNKEEHAEDTKHFQKQIKTMEQGQAERNRNLHDKIDGIGMQLQGLDDSIREEHENTGKRLEQKTKRLNDRVDALYGDLQREINRASSMEIEINGDLAKSKSELESAVSKLANETAQGLETQLRQQHEELSSFSENKVAAARAWLKAKIEAEESQRTAAIDNLRQELVEADHEQESRQSRMLEQSVTHSERTLRALIHQELSKCNTALDNLTNDVEARTINLRKDLERVETSFSVQAAMDQVCFQAENSAIRNQLESQISAHNNLKQTLDRQMANASSSIKSEASTRYEQIDTLKEEIKQAVENLSTTHSERSTELKLFQESASSEMIAKIEDLMNRFNRLSSETDSRLETTTSTLSIKLDSGMNEISTTTTERLIKIDEKVDNNFQVTEKERLQLEAKVKEQTGTIGESVIKLSAELGNVSTRVTQMNESCNKLENDLSTRLETKADVSVTSDLQKKLGEEIKNLQELLVKNSKALETSRTEIFGGIASEAQVIKESLGSVEKRVESISAEVSDANNRHTALHGMVSALQESKADKSDTSQLSDAVESAKLELKAEIANTLEELEKTKESSKSSAARTTEALQQNLAQVETQIKAFVSKVDAMKSEQDALGATVLGLEDTKADAVELSVLSEKTSAEVQKIYEQVRGEIDVTSRKLEDVNASLGIESKQSKNATNELSGKLQSVSELMTTIKTNHEALETTVSSSLKETKADSEDQKKLYVSVQKQIDELQDQLQDLIKNAMKEHENGKLKEETGRLQSSLKDVESQVKQLSESLGTVKESQESLGETVSALKDIKADSSLLKSFRDSTEEKLAQTAESVEECTKSQADLKEKLKVVESSVESIQKETAEAVALAKKSEVGQASIQEAVTSLHSTKAEYTSITELDQKIDYGLQAQHQAFEEQVRALTDDQQVISSKFEELEGVHIVIDTVQNEVGDLNSLIDSMKEKTEAVHASVLAMQDTKADNTVMQAGFEALRESLSDVSQKCDNLTEDTESNAQDLRMELLGQSETLRNEFNARIDSLYPQE